MNYQRPKFCPLSYSFMIYAIALHFFLCFSAKLQILTSPKSFFFLKANINRPWCPSFCTQVYILVWNKIKNSRHTDQLSYYINTKYFPSSASIWLVHLASIFDQSTKIFCKSRRVHLVNAIYFFFHYTNIRDP